MYKTYYLFVDEQTNDSIFTIFEKLRKLQTNFLQFSGVKEFDILPKAIVIETAYKDAHMKRDIKYILKQIGYNGKSELMTPLVKEVCIM